MSIEKRQFGRLIYVDPNNKRSNSPDNAIENAYEDYSTFIDLDVIRYDRRNPLNPPQVESHKYKTNFMPGTDGWLSTSYTDILSLNPGEGNSETLGITSIDISYNSWFYPQVTISFVDIRGSALMAPQDKALYNTEQYERSQIGSATEWHTELFGGSVFKSLFTFPYPEFRLTVKGFYGKPVVLRLCVSKMNIKLNSSNGSFELVVDFIGNMYGMYTDIPMHLLTIAPYTDPVPGKIYNTFWDGGTSSIDENRPYYYEGENGEFQKPMLTFPELNFEIEKFVQNEDNVLAERPDLNSTYKSLDEKKSGLEKLLDNQLMEWGNIDSSDGTMYWIEFINRDDIQKLSRDVLNYILAVEEAGIKFSFKGLTLFELGRDVLMESKVGVGNVVSVSKLDISGGYNVNLLSNQLSDTVAVYLDNKGNYVYSSNRVDINDFIKINKDNQGFRNSLIHSIGTTKYIITLHVSEKFDVLLSNAIKQAEQDLLTEDSKLKKEKGKLLIQTLGFYPSIKNIFKMVYAHLDVFAGLFYGCLGNICDKMKSGERKVNKSEKLKMDFMPLGNDDYTIPPFAMFYQKNHNDDSVTYDAMFPSLSNLRMNGVTGLESELDEVVLVRKLIAGARANINQQQAFNKFIEELRDKNTGTGTFNVSFTNIPITPYDFTHGSDNPYYYVQEMADDTGKAKNFADYVMTTFAIRLAYYKLLMGTRFGKTIPQTFSITSHFPEFEANNVFSLIREKHEIFLSSFDGISVSKYAEMIKNYSFIPNQDGEIPIGYTDKQYFLNGDTGTIEAKKAEGKIINTTNKSNNFENFRVYSGDEYESILSTIKTLSNNSDSDKYRKLLDDIYTDDNSPFTPDKHRETYLCSNSVFYDSTFRNNLKIGNYGRAALMLLSLLTKDKFIGGIEPLSRSVFEKKGGDYIMVPTSNGVQIKCRLLLEGAIYKNGGIVYDVEGSKSSIVQRNITIGEITDGRKNYCIDLFTKWLDNEFMKIINEYAFKDVNGNFLGGNDDLKKAVVNSLSKPNRVYTEAILCGNELNLKPGNLYAFELPSANIERDIRIGSHQYPVLLTHESYIEKDGKKYSNVGYYFNSEYDNPQSVTLKLSGNRIINSSEILTNNEVFPSWLTYIDITGIGINDKILVFDTVNFNASNWQYLENACTIALNNFKSNLVHLLEKAETVSTSYKSSVGEGKSVGEDYELALYMTLANLYKKWLCGKDKKIFHLSGKESEFKKALFIDGFYNRIGHRFMVNLTKLTNIMSSYILSENQSTNEGAVFSKEYSIYQFLSLLCQENEMMFLALPCEFSHMAEQIDSAFTPYAYSTSQQISSDTTSYVCIYPSKPAENLSNVSEYADEGFNLAGSSDNQVYIDNSMFTVPPGEYTGIQVPAFGINYAKNNQSFFRDITLNMDNAQTTDYSILATLNIASKAGETGKATSVFGQDIYRVYSNYSYNCGVEMMGCMQIMPLMYFQLNNIPMWRGAYMISKVSHKIKPGSMTTSFSGYRVSKYRIPLSEPYPYYAPDIQINSVENGMYEGIEYSTIYPKKAGKANILSVDVDEINRLINNSNYFWEEYYTKQAADYVYSHCPNTDPNHHLCARYTYNIARCLLYPNQYKCNPSIFAAGGNANQPSYWGNLTNMGYKAYRINSKSIDGPYITYQELIELIGRENYGINNPSINNAWGVVVAFYDVGGSHMHTQIYCGTDIKNENNTLNYKTEKESIANNKKNPWVADNVYPNRIPYYRNERKWDLIIFIPPVPSEIPPYNSL